MQHTPRIDHPVVGQPWQKVYCYKRPKHLMKRRQTTEDVLHWWQPAILSNPPPTHEYSNLSIVVLIFRDI